MINLFVFDWSGTISDDRKPVYEANMRILKLYNKPVMPFEEWLSVTGMFPQEFFKNHGIDDDPNKLFELYKKYYTEIVKSGIKPILYDDVIPVLNHLIKNKEIAVLSSYPEENLLKEAEDYGIISYINLILGSSTDKVQGLIEISERLGEKSEDILYIGDTIYDIRSGKGAGTLTAAAAGTEKKTERVP